jgi:hypothetical protein
MQNPIKRAVQFLGGSRRANTGGGEREGVSDLNHRHGLAVKVKFLQVFLVSLTLAVTAHGQVDTGAILGTIKDQSGAVIPRAKIALRNDGTNFYTSTQTGTDGSYILTPVRIGTYTVTAEFQGFHGEVRPHIVVNVQQQVVVDFTLVPGSETQMIEVTAEPGLLQTQNASVSQVVSSTAINNLPLNGRNYFFLAQLSPGVTFSQQDARGEESNGRFAANGTPPTQNNYLLDGLDNNTNINTVQNGKDFVVRTPIDALAEFKVQTLDYSAEFGRGAGAVLNATTKSGTNSFHGDMWEFLRNDALDATDFFLNAANKPKGAFRRNEFGFTAGGPVYIPHIYNGRNKTFIFGDYQGTRIAQANVFSSTVPTLAEQESGYTNFSDLIPAQSGSRTDILGRSFPSGTIFDPATTRSVTNGQADPVTGLVATANGFVRDPFSENTIPGGRIDSNAVKLLELLPAPNQPGIFNNYISDPTFTEGINQFDVRVDEIVSGHDQIFGRYSYVHDNRIRPGPFPGYADGSNPLNDASLQDHSLSTMLSETHTFSPTLINEARIGVSRERANFLQPYANVTGIPQQFGIQGVPQTSENGGLPYFSVGSFSNFGAPYYIPSDKYSTVYQLTENLTKVHASHGFKAGVEIQDIRQPLVQPPFSRGFFIYSGGYTSVVSETDSTTGVASFLLAPTTATVPNGVNNGGGASDIYFSNFLLSDLGRGYYGAYVQDDWKVSRKLTVNLGVRWDWFGPLEERHGNEANFVPGTPFNGATFWIPTRTQALATPSFLSALANDGIRFAPSTSLALGTVQKTNFAPRFGLAYQVTPKLVLRTGFGLFYGGYQEEGQGTYLGGNFPFQYNLSYVALSNVQPITPNNSIGTLETSLQNISLVPASVNVAGIGLYGNQYNWLTPYSEQYNFSLQYQISPNASISVGYVGSVSRHLVVIHEANTVTELAPPTANAQLFVPFPDFARDTPYDRTEGAGNYNSLQVTAQKYTSHGLNFLANYTWSKILTDVRDPAEDDIGGYRAPGVPGFGVINDYALADYDVRQLVHLSGGYDLPLGGASSS